MGKVRLANIAPHAFPRVRGNFLVQPGISGLIVRKWPKPRGPAKTAAQYFAEQQFALASKMAANSEPKQWETAFEMTKGTQYVPRDLLVKAAYGALGTITDQYGNVWRQASHAYPGEEQQESIRLLQWQPNQIQNTWGVGLSGSAYAFKGVIIKPTQPIILDAVMVYMSAISGATYRAISAELNGSNVIQSIVTSPTIAPSTTETRFFEFDVNTTLQPGTEYAIMVGRTDSTDTYAMPIPGGSSPGFIIPATSQDYVRLAKADPQVGDTVGRGTPMYAMALLLDF